MERNKEASVAGTKGSKQERWLVAQKNSKNIASKLATKVQRRERKQNSKEGWHTTKKDA